MKISIVTPSYNQGRFIWRCIESVKNQEGDFAIEHIILDNCSTDSTTNLLAQYKEEPGNIEVIIFSEKDGGQSAALNKGFEIASGEIIGWLNADDYYDTAIVGEAAKQFEISDQIDIVYFDYYIIDENDKIVKLQIETDFDLEVLKYYGCNMPTTTMFFRKKIFENGIFLNEALHYSMDADFFIRLGQKGYTFKHVNKPLAYFRQHANAKSIKDKELQKAEGFKVRHTLCFPNFSKTNAQSLTRALKRIYYLKRIYLKVIAYYKYYCQQFL